MASLAIVVHNIHICSTMWIGLLEKNGADKLAYLDGIRLWFGSAFCFCEASRRNEGQPNCLHDDNSSQPLGHLAAFARDSSQPGDRFGTTGYADVWVTTLGPSLGIDELPA
jgi:hypothetical protein